MEQILRGKVAIITGASKGIGRATALLFASEGAKIVAGGRAEGDLMRLRSEIRAGGVGDCAYVVGNVDDPENPQALVDTALREFGRLDILVCSAGVALRDKTLDMRTEDWDYCMRVNLTAPMELSRLCIREFLKQDSGKIVYVSSNAGRHTNMGASPSYGASKAGLLYLTRHFATEFAAHQIYVNAVLPGPVDTEITKTWTPEHRASVLANLPMGRLGKPEDIASCVLFLASGMSDYVTGACVAANGGRNMD